MDVPPWENVLFLGDASGRRFIRDARSKFSLSLSFSFLLGTKGDNGIVVGFVCHSTPSYFDFSRFKYCTIYILWFAHRRGREREEICFTSSIFTPCFQVRISDASSPRKGNRSGNDIKIMQIIVFRSSIDSSQELPRNGLLHRFTRKWREISGILSKFEIRFKLKWRGEEVVRVEKRRLLVC